MIKELEHMHKKGKFLPNKRLGNAFRYGKFAVVSAMGVCRQSNNQDPTNIDQDVETLAKVVIKGWTKFEKFAIAELGNQDYFSRGDKDFNNYYKGSTLNSNIRLFWGGDITKE
jgi:hypothetical protein